MRWRKLGLVWQPGSGPVPGTSHAALAVPIQLEDRVRVIHTVRDTRGRSLGAWFDFRPDAPSRILASANVPSLVPGRAGFFDDAGTMPSTAWWDGDELRLLYVGWNVGTAGPFRLSIGLAISMDGGKTFTKYSDGPVMDRSVVDPAFIASPAVVPGESLRILYVSGLEWVEGSQGLQYRCHLKYAESDDGIVWNRLGRVAIDFADAGEYAIARPTVLCDGETYRMWFSSRGDVYRIRYAESIDGVVWDRRPDVVLDTSVDGWDSEMTAYPAVFDWRGERYMLYNGNGFGRTGIGLAVLDAD